jgi:PAS domain S-box-containing protein
LTNHNSGKEKLLSGLENVRQQLIKLERLASDNQPEEESLSRLLIELPAAVYITQDHVIKFVSPQLRQVTGYLDNELIGASRYIFALKEDRHIIRKNINDLLKTRRPTVFQYRVLLKNSAIKWVMESVALTSYHGKSAVIANIVDITENKQAEDAVRRSEGIYHDLCENINDMILCLSPGGLIVYANRPWQETTGHQEKDIINLSLFEIIPPDYKEQWHDLLQQAVAGENLNDVETVFISKSGNKVPVEGNINCRFIDSKPIYTRGIFRDLTKRKQQKAKEQALLKEVEEIKRRLDQSNREIEEFAHVASHDLQEPMRKITSFGIILRESLKDTLDDDQRENLGYMLDGAERMQLMIDDLLVYSRISSGDRSRGFVDPNKVVENLKNFEIATLIDEVQGRILVPRALSIVYGDLPQIHQLFQNLIENGLKFHKDGETPTVTISSSQERDNMVRFYVQDNGIGIDPAYYEQVFIMFKRLHSPKSYRGTGIGLAICQKIVQLHGGQIGIHSNSDKGTTFWFTLPRFNQTEPPDSKDGSSHE